MTETHAGGPGDARATQRGGRGGTNPFARLLVFLRQVVAELKKVVRPTRSELITYTSVVLVFVLIVMLYVSGLDLLFTKLVFWVFGGS